MDPLPLPPSMGKKKYACDACDFSTDRINSLMMHRKGHTGTPSSKLTVIPEKVEAQPEVKKEEPVQEQEVKQVEPKKSPVVKESSPAPGPPPVVLAVKSPAQKEPVPAPVAVKSTVRKEPSPAPAPAPPPAQVTVVAVKSPAREEPSPTPPTLAPVNKEPLPLASKMEVPEPKSTGNKVQGQGQSGHTEERKRKQTMVVMEPLEDPPLVLATKSPANPRPTATIKPTVPTPTTGGGESTSSGDEEPAAIIRQALEGGLKSPPEKDRPEVVAEKVVHVLPVENADGTVTHMFQLEEDTELRVDSVNGNSLSPNAPNAIYMDQPGNLQQIFNAIGTAPKTPSVVSNSVSVNHSATKSKQQQQQQQPTSSKGGSVSMSLGGQSQTKQQQQQPGQQQQSRLSVGAPRTRPGPTQTQQQPQTQTQPQQIQYVVQQQGQGQSEQLTEQGQGVVGMDGVQFMDKQPTFFNVGDEQLLQSQSPADDSGASAVYPQCSALRKNGFVMIKARPCKIVEMSTRRIGKQRPGVLFTAGDTLNGDNFVFVPGLKIPKGRQGHSAGGGNDTPIRDEPRVEPVDGIVQPAYLPTPDRPGRLTNILLQIQDDVLTAVWNKASDQLLRYPVNANTEGIPDYHRIIQRPMDLSTIKKRLENNYYWSAEECISSFKLLFENAYDFNNENPEVYEMVEEVEAVFIKKHAEIVKKNEEEKEIEPPSRVKSKRKGAKPKVRRTVTSSQPSPGAASTTVSPVPTSPKASLAPPPVTPKLAHPVQTPVVNTVHITPPSQPAKTVEKSPLVEKTDRHSTVSPDRSTESDVETQEILNDDADDDPVELVGEFGGQGQGQGHRIPGFGDLCVPAPVGDIDERQTLSPPPLKHFGTVTSSAMDVDDRILDEDPPPSRGIEPPTPKSIPVPTPPVTLPMPPRREPPQKSTAGAVFDTPTATLAAKGKINITLSTKSLPVITPIPAATTVTAVPPRVHLPKLTPRPPILHMGQQPEIPMPPMPVNVPPPMLPINRSLPPPPLLPMATYALPGPPPLVPRPPVAVLPPSPHLIEIPVLTRQGQSQGQGHPPPPPVRALSFPSTSVASAPPQIGSSGSESQRENEAGKSSVVNGSEKSSLGTEIDRPDESEILSQEMEFNNGNNDYEKEQDDDVPELANVVEATKSFKRTSACSTEEGGVGSQSLYLSFDDQAVATTFQTSQKGVSGDLDGGVETEEFGSFEADMSKITDKADTELEQMGENNNNYDVPNENYETNDDPVTEITDQSFNLFSPPGPSGALKSFNRSPSVEKLISEIVSEKRVVNIVLERLQLKGLTDSESETEDEIPVRTKETRPRRGKKAKAVKPIVEDEFESEPTSLVPIKKSKKSAMVKLPEKTVELPQPSVRITRTRLGKEPEEIAVIDLEEDKVDVEPPMNIEEKSTSKKSRKRTFEEKVVVSPQKPSKSKKAKKSPKVSTGGVSGSTHNSQNIFVGRSWLCDLCNKGFPFNWKLLRHRRVHRKLIRELKEANGKKSHKKKLTARPRPPIQTMELRRREGK